MPYVSHKTNFISSELFSTLCDQEINNLLKISINFNFNFNYLKFQLKILQLIYLRIN